MASVVVGADEHLVKPCVRTLLETAGDHDVTVRVTLNRPNPQLVAELTDHFPQVTTIENATPLGFAENHNRALTGVDAEFLLVANDDLEFEPACVSRILDFLALPESRDIGSVSPKLLNTDGTLQRSTYRFPTVPRALLDLSGLRALVPHNAFTDGLARVLGRGRGRSRFWSHDRTCDVDTFRGAAMFIRADTWTEVGPLSEATRVGGETGEWHRRCRDAGWRVVYFAEVAAIHHGSRTVGRDRLLQSEYLKGYLVYFARHRSPIALGLFRAVGFFIALARLVVARLMDDRVGVLLWRTNLTLLAQPVKP